MGFVRRNLSIEESFAQISDEWKSLSDKEYKALVSNWRNSFEELVQNGVTLKGGEAVQELVEKLPCEVYVFSMPNYKYSPIQSSHGMTYGYKVANLRDIKREVLNENETIVCDANVSFTCVFNHESDSFYPEAYYEI